MSARTLCLLPGLFACSLTLSAAEPECVVKQDADGLTIVHGERPVVEYVVKDSAILRPYFTRAYSPSGDTVTRAHPPRPGIDAVDHDTMHPGIWLAFGDLGGGDFWRNKGRVEHVEFMQQPAIKDSVLSFSAKNRYLSGEREVCRELAQHTLRVVGDGYLLTFDSQFTGEAPFAFGDQEEMGLGVRLATPLAVKAGGSITNSEGRKNEKEVWGRTADWCDYSGTQSGRRAGLLVVPHPKNFRPCWFHARDYGFIAANPFGQKAFTKGPISRVEVKPGETLRLRYGIWIYASPKPVELPEIARQYIQLMDER